jgi:hypothetical protein
MMEALKPDMTSTPAGWPTARPMWSDDPQIVVGQGLWHERIAATCSARWVASRARAWRVALRRPMISRIERGLARNDELANAYRDWLNAS